MKTCTTKQTGSAVARGRRSATVAAIRGQTAAPIVSPKRVPAKWRWHYRALLALQNRLLQERGDLLGAAAAPLEPHSLDEADSATDEFDHDLALTQLSAKQNALCEVNEALQRILENSYGICEATGKAIPAARLRAIPWTRFARNAEERLEKDEGVRRAGLSKAATVRRNGHIWLAPEEAPEETEAASLPPPNDEALTVTRLPNQDALWPAALRSSNQTTRGKSRSRQERA